MGSFISSIFSSSSSEEIINCELTSHQVKYSRLIAERKINLILSNQINFQQQKIIFNDFQKVYDHPFLFQDAKNEILHDKAENSSTSYDDIFVSSSGKMIFLHNFLPKMVKEGHKILIVSIFQKMASLISDYLKHIFPKICLFDNSVRGKKRQELIDDFLNGNIDIFVMSVETPQQGINLTAADTIIVYDSNFEPQNYSDAIDCCLKKNKKDVKIYRLVSEKSYELELINFMKNNNSKDTDEICRILLRYSFYYAYKHDILRYKQKIDVLSPNFWSVFKFLYQKINGTEEKSNNNRKAVINSACKEISEKNLSSVPSSIKKYLCSNLQKINKVITTKNPPVILYFDEKEADSLPTKYLQVYNIEGKKTDLGFETESIFIHPEGEKVDRIYYNEIHKISFIPIEGYNNNFVIFVFESDFGFRALLFVEKRFQSIMTNVININKKKSFIEKLISFF